MNHICITGASSGLGRALALEYAGSGVFLTLWARNEARLLETARLCRERGAETAIVSQDIRDLNAVRARIASIADARPVDLAILASGVITGTTPDRRFETVVDACRTLNVNLLANANMGACLLDFMREKRAGHIVFICSIAGMYPLPNSPAYSASKQGLSFYAGALAAEGELAGVRVSRVYPGYLETPMGVRLKAAKPLTKSAECMASVIRRDLARGKDRIVYPFAASVAVRFLGWLPKALGDALGRKFGYTVVPDGESDMSS